MRRKERNAAHFILLVLVTAFVLLIANILVFTGLFAKWKEDIPFGSQTIMDNLTEDQGSYSLSEDAKAALTQDDLFAMLISQEGHILWRERLPEELEKEYSLQDVASFTRYYLNDYPVHTYIVPEGLLIIGSQKHTTWKYTLEYNEEMIRQFMRQMPIILLINIALLISVPLFIQRKWLRRREEERTEWIAGVSHDIRTPLTLILGNADYIGQNPDDPSVTGRADTIRRQGLRIRALVANLNTSSKLDFGMGDYKKSPINVGSLIRKTVTDFLNRDPDDKYGFTLDIPDDLQNITTVANEELFRRMLENLINNSIRHNPSGCEISIGLAADRTRSNRCILQISDNGQGTSAEILKALNRRSINKAGKLSEHGIGLRLVKQIAQFHAWKVSFSNNEPQGFACRINIKLYANVLLQSKRLFETNRDEKMDNIEFQFHTPDIIKVNNRVWLLNDCDEATGYLIEGEDCACVIDTMTGFVNVRAEVEKLTDKPLLLINTHGYSDHVGGNWSFDKAYLHPADLPVAKEALSHPVYMEARERFNLRYPDFLPLSDGQIFSLGGLELQAYLFPGHTPGEIVLLDRKDRILFSGDGVLEQLWLQLPESLSVKEQKKSMERLLPFRN